MLRTETVAASRCKGQNRLRDVAPTFLTRPSPLDRLPVQRSLLEYLGRPYAIDDIGPLARHGEDPLHNMQWQTGRAAKEKTAGTPKLWELNSEHTLKRCCTSSCVANMVFEVTIPSRHLLNVCPGRLQPYR